MVLLHFIINCFTVTCYVLRYIVIVSCSFSLIILVPNNSLTFNVKSLMSDQVPFKNKILHIFTVLSGFNNISHLQIVSLSKHLQYIGHKAVIKKSSQMQCPQSSNQSNDKLGCPDLLQCSHVHDIRNWHKSQVLFTVHNLKSTQILLR